MQPLSTIIHVHHWKQISPNVAPSGEPHPLRRSSSTQAPGSPGGQSQIRRNRRSWDHWERGDLQCEAPKIAKLVNITPISMVYGTQITIVFMGFKNQLITGGPHIV